MRKKTPDTLAREIEAAFLEMETQAKAGDEIAAREFERLLWLYHRKYRNELWERAKAGDKSFNSASSIWDLLGETDVAIERLEWLAKNKSEECQWIARQRLTWPAYIGTLSHIEHKGQELKEYLKKYVQFGQDFSHYKPKTDVDILFRAARFIIRNIGGELDWRQLFVFWPFVKGIEWLPREECRNAVKAYIGQIGPMTQSNWSIWKPIFERWATLCFGPAPEVWKLIPDTRRPKRKGMSKSVLCTWKDDLNMAIRFGTTQEWFDHYTATHRLTDSQKTDLLNDIRRYAAAENRRSIMDVSPDAALSNIARRSTFRQGGWGDYKTALLTKCKRLLPP
jgi:hypothetical protein